MKRLHLHYAKPIALFWIFTILFQIGFPVASFALTSGPTQPENTGFTPAGTSDMVDLFTGDFHYNIPLFDLDGYPVNLSYQANTGMEEDASWVGLGWSLNPGVINRNLRGLPDDFKGDKVKRTVNMRDNYTVGANGAFSGKLLGFETNRLTTNIGLFYNNYKGWGFEFGISPSSSIAKLSSDKTQAIGGLDLSYNSQNGIDIGLSLGLNAGENETIINDVGAGLNYNSREGVKGMNFSVGFHKPCDQDNKVVKYNGGLSFSSPTYTPVPDIRFKTRSLSVEVGIGGELALYHPNAKVSGFYSQQFIDEKVMEQSAYGYLHSTIGERGNDNNLLDYNKEITTVPFSEKMKKMPLSQGTPDLFNASGQGLSAQFKAVRGDVGIFRDAANHTGSLGANVGLSFGAGGLSHTSGSLSIPWSNNNAGAWKKGNEFREKFEFQDLEPQGHFEPASFKDAGEMTIVANSSFYDKTGMFDPAYVQLEKIGLLTKAKNKLRLEKLQQPEGEAPVSSIDVKKSVRDRKNAVFSYLTSYQADLYGFDKKIKSYDNSLETICEEVEPTEISRLEKPKHHISEVTVTQPGGSRYVFGIPVYNNFQKDVTFSTNSTPASPNGALVTYATGENSTGNQSGFDHYFEERVTPAYASSFLLTALLSPDYVDLTGNGVSEDDAGTAVKFNYARTGLYHWRAPLGLRTARYNPGNRADAVIPGNDKHDNKASYVYGEREQWYMHSIESKNYVARFYTSNRNDGVGVIDENGNIDLNAPRLQRLDKIEIYSKSELNRPNNSDPVPIKTVHFKYFIDQDNLCPGTPNNPAGNNGKLTLQGIYFTYGKNNRGSKNVYKFDYARAGSTAFTYNVENVDRWGMYKNSTGLSVPANTNFPYALQPDGAGITKELLDEYASAWNLNKITLPTGAEINIDYESDTYAYVMNKRAGQYVFVKGFSESSIGSADALLYNVGQYSGVTNANYIHLKLPEPVEDADAFKKLYLEDVKQLYFNCRVKLTPTPFINSDYDYISGYAEIDFDATDAITLSNSNNTAILKLKSVNGDRGVNLNPITKAALTTLRTELPELAYGPPPVDFSNTDIEDGPKIVKGLVTFMEEIGDLLAGFDKIRTLGLYAREIDVNNESWVRLANPTYNKFGGGSRVKKITISDEWGTMAGNDHQNASYSTEYDYSMQSPNDTEQTISSGVASYEPIMGNEENLWREPIRYKNKKLWLGPRNHLYQEGPVGEPLFPSAVVGYSQVKVTSSPGVPHPEDQRTGTGYAIYRFFTAKDFPTKFDYTTLHFKRVRPNPVMQIFKLFSRAKLVLSQGFMVEVNDMHGKPKSEEIYNEAGTLISSTTYKYKTEQDGSLKNTVNVMHLDGTISSGLMGVDMDVWEDMSQEENKSSALGFVAGADVPPFPIIGVHAFPIIQNDESTLQTTTTTKFIKRFGILEEVIKMENGASLSSKNLVYDSETSEPLLVETQSEYDESPVYQFKYPAHWAYDGMGQSYKNQDVLMQNVTLNATTGEITNASAVQEWLNDGDEVIVIEENENEGDVKDIDNAFGNPRFRTYFVSKQPNSPVYLIDFAGSPIHTNPGNPKVSLRVKRSARRNMASASIGAFQSLVNPVTDNSGTMTFAVNSATKVLQASAATFSDKWRIPYAYTRLNCNDAASLEDAADLICAIIATDNWFAQGLDICTLPNISSFNGLDCSNGPIVFSAMTDENAYRRTALYQAKVGDCVISLRSENGAPFYLDSLQCDSTMGGGGGGTKLSATHTTIRDQNGNPMNVNIECLSCPEEPCNESSPIALGQPINPYFLGIFGNWRPQSAYAFDDQQTRNYSTGKLKNDGYYTSFNAFWNWATGGLSTNTTNWIKANTVTKYNKAGSPIEEQDALGKYETALYGFKNMLPIARSSNCRYTQIAYEGFEEDLVASSIQHCIRPFCHQRHFPYELASGAELTNEQMHTGEFSLKLPPGGSSATFSGGKEVPDDVSPLELVLPGVFPYKLGQHVNIGTFQPVGATDRTYVISAWVYSDLFNCDANVRANPPQVLSVSGISQLPGGGKPSGPVIDGWRKMEEIVTVPASWTSMEIVLNNALSGAIYIDDVRVHPYDGSMQSFAYDPYSLRLAASLDERNYATFFEYDDAGILVRTKRETEKGIITVNESKSYLKPNPF